MCLSVCVGGYVCVCSVRVCVCERVYMIFTFFISFTVDGFVCKRV